MTRTAIISEDEKLFVEELRRGSNEAFEKLVRNYEQNMLRIAINIVGPIDADDAVQQTFIAVFNKIHDFRGESAFHNWIFKILINQCLIILRKLEVRRAYSLEEMFNYNPFHKAFVDKKSVSASNLFEQKELRLLLIRGLSEVNLDFRKAIFLRYYCDFKIREVAEILDTKENNIRIRCFRGLKIVREKLAHDRGLKSYIQGFTN